MIILDSIRSSSKESRSNSRPWNFTITADGDIERDKKEAERRGFRKVISIIDYARARDSIREITNLIDAGLIHVPPTEVLPLRGRCPRASEDRHWPRPWKLVLKVAELAIDRLESNADLRG